MVPPFIKLAIPVPCPQASPLSPDHNSTSFLTGIRLVLSTSEKPGGSANATVLSAFITLPDASITLILSI